MKALLTVILLLMSVELEALGVWSGRTGGGHGESPVFGASFIPGDSWWSVGATTGTSGGGTVYFEALNTNYIYIKVWWYADQLFTPNIALTEWLGTPTFRVYKQRGDDFTLITEVSGNEDDNNVQRGFSSNSPNNIAPVPTFLRIMDFRRGDRVLFVLLPYTAVTTPDSPAMESQWSISVKAVVLEAITAPEIPLYPVGCTITSSARH